MKRLGHAMLAGVALSVVLAWAGLPALSARGDVPLDFDKDIKPILQQNCFKCHGPDKQRGGMRLDVKASALKGGDSGEPAIVPGSALKSHLLKLVTSNEPDEMMPPKGERLKAEQVALLKKWIETGAHWIGQGAPETALESATQLRVTEEDRKFWSFVAPKAVKAPAIMDQGWVTNRIDRFILAKLEERGLRPSGETSKSVLIRRLSYDLTGLPPTPEEVETFLSDEREDSYERLVDRLLDSPRFGEHMASLWLPMARYGEDQAHQVGKDTKFFYPYAWKYRKWLIDAFNRDLPYDQFIKLQLAADKMGATEQDSGAVRANTRFAPTRADGMGAAKEDLAALGFVGLGPKYYGRNRLSVMADEWEDRVDTVTRTMLGLTVACARCHDHKFDPIPTHDYYALAGVFASTKMVNKTPDGVEQKGDLKADQLDAATIHIVEDDQVKDLNLFIRGNADRKGPVVPRRFLSVLSPAEPAPFEDGSGRKELAEAIASRDNPLTARVMVNRLWGMMTGAPLVATPSNFGHSGALPTHPELLDDLAVRFMDNGWSMKWLLREIALSSAYRQGTAHDSRRGAIDPGNELLWRMNRRRLTVEQWRDSVLLVSGALDLSGGKSLELDDPANLKRTVHARISRLKLNDLLMHFDYPDANVHAEGRSVTNTPAQKLIALNSAFVIGNAKSLSARLAEEVSDDGVPRIRRAYQVVFAREPGSDEIKLALDFLKKPSTSEMSRWEQYAQVLLASNEAMYVD